MLKTLSAAAIAISLVAGSAFAQGNVPVVEPVKVQATVKPTVHKPGMHKASLHKKHRAAAHRHTAHHRVTHRHVTHGHVAHVKPVHKHVAKHIKPAKAAKRLKQDKINTAG